MKAMTKKCVAGMLVALVWSGLYSIVQFAAAAEAVPGIPREQLVLWLKADAGVSVSGDLVSMWQDQSGNGNDAFTEGGYEPKLITNAVNGRPALRFNGEQKTYVVVPHKKELDAGESMTLFVVYRYANGVRLMQKRSYVVGISADAWYANPAAGIAVAGIRSADTLFPAGETFQVQSNVFDAKKGFIDIYRNGTEVARLANAIAQTPNNHDLYIGKRLHNTNETPFTGEIAEILIYNRALTPEERVSVEKYLLVKYGL